MRGLQARCRGCGQTLQVAGPDPLGLAETAAAIPQLNVLSAPLSLGRPPDEYDIPWATLKRIGLFGGLALAIVVVVTTIFQLVAPLLRG
jgi:hypothetical protein